MLLCKESREEPNLVAQRKRALESGATAQRKAKLCNGFESEGVLCDVSEREYVEVLCNGFGRLRTFVLACFVQDASPKDIWSCLFDWETPDQVRKRAPKRSAYNIFIEKKERELTVSRLITHVNTNGKQLLSPS